MEQANAAQMAARSIKGLKNSRRKPVQSIPGAQQSMSFGGGAPAGQGGLFGGTIQSAGSFDFSAPSSVSFPPSPFGGNNIFGAPSNSTSDSGIEAGVGGDEDRRKKTFRGGPGPATNTPAQSSLFGQTQQPNLFGSVNGQASNPFGFSQSASQPPSPGLAGFGSAPAQTQPATNIFSFGGTTSQSASPGPSNIFGSAPSQPASNSFTFGQTASQPAQQPTSTYSFGSPAPSAAQDKPANVPFSFTSVSTSGSAAVQEKPASSLFSLGQTTTPVSSVTQDKPNLFALAQSPGLSFSPSQPTGSQSPDRNDFGQSQSTSSGVSFGSTPAVEKPLPNMFGTSKPPQSTQSASPANIFSSMNIPAAPSSTLFGGQQESKTVETPGALFGTETRQTPATNNLFGNTSQTPAKTNPFGELKAATLSSSSLFSNVDKPAESLVNFSGSAKPSPTNNLFGGPSATSTNSLFGTLNKPVDQLAPEPKVNGAPVTSTTNATSGESTTSSLFNKTPSTSVPGSISLPVFTTAPQAETTTTGSNTPFSFGASSAPKNDNNSSPFSFGSAQLSAPKTQTNGNSSTSFTFGSTQTSALNIQTDGKPSSAPMKPMEAPSSASQPPPSGMFPKFPPPTPTKSNGTAGSSPTSTALTTIPDKTATALVNGNATEEFDYDSLYAEIAAASALSDEQMAPLVPASFSDSQKVDFFTAYRLRLLNKAVEGAFNSIMFNVGISNLISYYNEKKVEILDRSSLPYPGSKRKSVGGGFQEENESRPKRSRPDAAVSSNIFQPQPATPSSKHGKLLDDKNQENESPNSGSRPDAPPKSNIFQSQPHTQTLRIPETNSRSQDQPQPYLNGNTPKPPSFAIAAQPNAVPLSSSPSKGKRKAEVQLTKDDHEREEKEERRLKNPTPISNSKVDSGDSEGSNTSNIFKSIVDSPSKEKKIAPLRGFAPPPSDDSPRGNPFNMLSVPKSPTKPTTSETTTNFALTPGSDGTSKLLKSIPAKNANPFQPKPAPSGLTKSNTDAQKPNVLQKPTFNLSGVDPLAEFAKAGERARMEKAKAEDKDSDEDSDEWEANWKAEEESKKKEFAELTKGKAGFVFKAASGSAASSTSGSFSEVPAVGSDIQSATALPSFGYPVQSSGNSAFGSRASTPGAVGSSTGSVLDSYTSGQPLLGNNFFSHVSDAGSGADSGLADEDSGSTTDGEEDSENKDPNYDPVDDSNSGPGTPVEETGAGIASAKKKASTTPFSFGSSALSSGLGGGPDSGTSSPSRSLFERVTRDSSGSAVRQVPTEDQENTPPTTNSSSLFAHLNNKTPPATATTPSLFAGLNKTSPAVPNTSTLFGSPNSTSVSTNQTWNPNTPILFGNTTPTSSVSGNNPTVSITEATPTKASTPNLFGNLTKTSSTPKSLFSGPGLFGSNPSAPSSSGSTTGGVGFSFGGQPSATSSLFPSAVASTTTSRATSPGNTTDGDSAAEDQDGEKHEQIDLTSGGPGTEDEEVIYEVRAKATKFVPGVGEKSGWVPKGLGPLRVLKHKETGATRLVLRADPSGVIVLNKALLSKIDYKADKKTVKLLTASDDGNGLETWILQVKTADMAEELAKVMESNKPS